MAQTCQSKKTKSKALPVGVQERTQNPFEEGPTSKGIARKTPRHPILLSVDVAMQLRRFKCTGSSMVQRMWVALLLMPILAHQAACATAPTEFLGKGTIEVKAKKGEKGEMSKGFLPLTQNIEMEKPPPWTGTTPDTRINRPKPSNSTLEESNADEDLQKHIQAIANHASLPAEVKAALEQYTKETPAPVTHGDLHRVKRLKTAHAKILKELGVEEDKWMRFQKLYLANYEAQKASFLEERAKLIQQAQEAQAKLTLAQKDLSAKVNAEESESDVGIPDNDKFQAHMDPPIWAVPDPELDGDGKEELTGMDIEGIKKDSNTMQPSAGLSSNKRRTSRDQG